MARTSQKLVARVKSAVDGLSRRIRPGWRFALGLMLMIGGVFGFLPVLGFWMIPLGAALAATDLRLLWRWFRRGGP